jgi:hypothetical protein
MSTEDIDKIMEIEERYSQEVTKRFKETNPEYKGSFRVGFRFGYTQPEDTLKKLNQYELNPTLKKELIDTYVEWAELKKTHVKALYDNDSRRRPNFFLGQEEQKAWNKYHEIKKTITDPAQLEEAEQELKDRLDRDTNKW